MRVLAGSVFAVHKARHKSAARARKSTRIRFEIRARFVFARVSVPAYRWDSLADESSGRVVILKRASDAVPASPALTSRFVRRKIRRFRAFKLLVYAGFAFDARSAGARAILVALVPRSAVLAPARPIRAPKTPKTAPSPRFKRNAPRKIARAAVLVAAHSFIVLAVLLERSARFAAHVCLSKSLEGPSARAALAVLNARSSETPAFGASPL